MLKRIRRFAGFTIVGLCFQFVGCSSNDVVEVIADGLKGTAAEITAIFVNAVIDEAFELN